MPQHPLPPPPGWFPDPQAPQHQLRWWDGTGWTTSTRPHPPTSDRRRRTITMGLAVAAAVVVLVIIAAIVIANLTSSDETETTSARPGTLHSDWIPAVCAPGTDVDGAGAYLAGANVAGHCSAASDVTRRIFIGLYPDMDTALRDLTILGPSAHITNTDGTVTVFAMDPNSGLTFLEPLRDYGFQFCARGPQC